MLCYKKLFPFFEQYPSSVYLDSAAATQKPAVMIQALENGYKEYVFPAGKSKYNEAEKAYEIYESAELSFRSLFGVPDAYQVSFFSSATNAFLLLSCIIPHIEKKTYCVAVPKDGHNTLINCALAIGNSVVWYDQYDYKDIDKADIVFVVGTSHISGHSYDIEYIKGLLTLDAIVIADFCQTAQYENVAPKGVDIAVYSAHKMYGPYGIAPVCFSDRILEKDSAGLIKKGFFHSGSLDIPGFYSFLKTLEWLKKNVYNGEVKEKLKDTVQVLQAVLVEYGFVIMSDPQAVHIVTCYHNQYNMFDCAELLATHDVLCRVGGMCADAWHKDKKIPHSLRFSVGCYTTCDDIIKVKEVVSKIF